MVKIIQGANSMLQKVQQMDIVQAVTDHLVMVGNQQVRAQHQETVQD